MDFSEDVCTEGNCAPAGIESHLKSSSNMLADITAMKHLDDEKEYNRSLNGSGCLNVVPFFGVDEEYSSNETILSELTTLVSPIVATNAIIASRYMDVVEVMDTNANSSTVQKLLITMKIKNTWATI
ncbi:unnamed protein product [Allacma fusca]|uniref:Uncharacterized protein n=1 Tax=Allacma fusca TaxID=39272 RepID=A0A8J2NLR4_9HEXA|nr:unnamed protein product [Allacma fusca]